MEERLQTVLTRFQASTGRMTVLTGAGISVESGIPTFRGPEGYWTIGSREFRPEEMATSAMFRADPWGVWSWYLYRRGVCLQARPNSGHRAVARIEALLGDRFKLITQNVDGLHLRAGNSVARTYQIHGNLHYMSCFSRCCRILYAIPEEIGHKEPGEPLTDQEKGLLRCPRCGRIARPHVLWFDETYDEAGFRSESSLRWAAQTDLLLTVGTSGATSLPLKIATRVASKTRSVLIDVNTGPNPFSYLALQHDNGFSLNGESGTLLPRIVDSLEQQGLRTSGNQEKQIEVIHQNT